MPKETIQLEDPSLALIDVDQAFQCVGSKASVEGEAVDRERAAAVKRGDLLVYLLDLERWPDDVLGKTVCAYGDLSRTSKDDGSVFALADFRYELSGTEGEPED